MPAAYMRSVYSTLDRAKHLAGVTSIPAATLDELCRKYNYAAINAEQKGKKTVFLTYLEGQQIRNTDQLTTRLNANANFLLQDMIDRLWLLTAQAIPPSQIIPYTQMFDPATEQPNASMLSHTVRGFRNLGVGFRGDNRAFDDFGPEGFVARYSVPPGRSFHVPEVHGTVIATGMFYDIQNRDFLNQTGVCVARNLLGSMKFIDSLKTTARLYAVQFRTGADTEAYQVARGGTALWRPGEKAAWQIPKQDILASIPVDVTLHDDNRTKTATGVWFQYRFRGDWDFHNMPDNDRKNYIQRSTFGRQQDVWYDFQRGDDFAL
jgi:hypothetical protein